MLSISVVGIGNCGSQIAALAMKKLNVPVIAINSSERDIQTLPEDVPVYLMGDAKGAGKQRIMAKQMLKKSVMDILENPKLRTSSQATSCLWCLLLVAVPVLVLRS